MKPPLGLAATDWLVQSVPDHGTASRFILNHHYSHSTSNTSVYRHGLYFDDPSTSPLVGELMGVALWLPPTRVAAESVEVNWRGVLSLSRFAVHPDAPKNAASFLLAASMRLVNRRTWPTLLTYADMGHGHTGAIYLATNWIRLGEVPAGEHVDGTERRAAGPQTGPHEPHRGVHARPRLRPQRTHPQDQVRAPDPQIPPARRRRRLIPRVHAGMTSPSLTAS